MKLTTLLFGLLLAVGWTSSAQAQALPEGGFAGQFKVKTIPALDALRLDDGKIESQMLNIEAGESVRANAPLRADANPEMVSLTYDDAVVLTYSWSNPETGESGTDVPATEEATDPYQIYELLRFVYMNPAFPGPTKSAWTSSSLPSLTTYDTREDPVYYGGIGGGWDIGATYTAVPNSNLTISFSSSTVNFDAIYLIAEGDTLKKWTCAENGTAIASATGWTVSGTVTKSQNYNFCYFSGSGYSSGGGSITIPYTQFSSGNYRSVKVIVHAANDNGYSGTISCAGYSQTPKAVASGSTVMASLADWGWTITGTETLAADGTYSPSQEGYTALIVSVKDKISAFPYVEPESYLGSCSFNTKKEIIDFIKLTIKSVKLLTDGLRIGKNSDYSRGTVFNCDGTYNRFFFLSKGQARKKSTYVNTQISNSNWPGYVGEEVPFKQMFEQFSPTTGGQGDEITDFYTTMMDGSVYNVVHDCASVIQNAHQFSMSGNTGETSYAMTGLNFFIPDFRLALWWNPQSINGTTRQYVDGRDFVPYQYYNNGWNSVTSAAGVWSAYFAQYNQNYAPKVGIYRITLEANAAQASGYNEVTYPYYQVTLDWTSSLNEMSGNDVPQKYEIYEVTYDEETGEEKLVLITTVEDVTTYSGSELLYEQEASSKTHTYVIKGWPTDSDHPSFIAWSNHDDVVIPGLADFLALDLDHYESDFIINEERNYYRNFLMVKNENDLKALTTGDVNSGVNKFTLYRYDVDNEDVLTPFAQLNFDNISTGATQAHYTLTYQDQTIEDYDINKAAVYNENNQLVSPAVNITDAYERSTMGIPDQGYVRIKGNGDIIIWPNGLSVNFKSIKVGNTTWTSSSSSLPSGWILSPGCQWVKYDDAYYLEGGGYIAVPASTTGNVNVTISAYGDGSTTSKITVNDVTRTITNGTASTYEWTVPAANRAPRRAGEVETATLELFDTAQYVAEYLPVYGYMHDCTQHNQMIYPASLLTDMVGKNITSMTFYLGSYNNYSGIRFYNGTVTFKLMEVNGSTGYDPDNLAFVTGTMKTVATVTMPSSANTSAETWQIDFDSDYEYNGGDLLIDVTTATGSWGRTYFLIGTTKAQGIDYPGYVTYSGSSTGSGYTDFVPRVDFTYETTSGGDEPDPGVDPTHEGNMLRLAIPVVDQFYASTAQNRHPRRYGYVLKYAPETENEKSSGKVEVPVQKTGSVVNGYYTLDEIDNDIDRGLTMDVLSADVQMTLSATNTTVFYNTIQGKLNDLPSNWGNYYTVLQRQSNGTFKEMKDPSDLYGKVYDPGVHHYYDSIETTGTYGTDYKTYVPAVTTMATFRRYFEYDSIHNTYGAPIWKTGVGEVTVKGTTIEKQSNNYGSTDWTVDGTNYSLYMIKNIQAVGKLPHTDVSNVEYRPYMFRVFVKSKSGNLRKFKKVAADPTNTEQPGEHLVDDGAVEGDLCIWSAYIDDEDSEANGVEFTVGEEGNQKTYTFVKNKVDRTGSVWNQDDANAMFGAPSALISGSGNNLSISDDLEVYVRFYYISTNIDVNASLTLRAGNDDVPAGYGVEDDSPAINPATAIFEIAYHGEVVSQTYYNVQGMESDKPFDGVNIVVTRFSDGTTSVSKVVK